MNETVESIFVGVIATLALGYLGFKVRQDRDRLKRMVSIIDEQHQFYTRHLLQLVDSGELQDCKLSPLTVGHPG